MLATIRFFTTAATVLSASALTTTPAYAHDDEPIVSGGGLYEDLIKSCADELEAGALPLTGWLSSGSEFSIWPRAHRDDVAPVACADFTWLKMRVTSSYFTFEVEGVDRDAANDWDCNHSTVSFGLYHEEADGHFTWTGGGSFYGNWENGACSYTTSGFPSGTTQWGNPIAGKPTNASGEYRVAFYQWAHNDPGIGHPTDYCPDGSGVQAENCHLPLRVSTLGDLAFPEFNFTSNWDGETFFEGTAGDDFMRGDSFYMFGMDGDDFLMPSDPTSMLFGGYGSDTYFWGHQSGDVVVYDREFAPQPHPSFDRVLFDGTVSAEDVSFERVGNDLRVVLSDSGATLDVWGYFTGPEYQVERFQLPDGTVLDMDALLLGL